MDYTTDRSVWAAIGVKKRQYVEFLSGIAQSLRRRRERGLEYLITNSWLSAILIIAAFVYGGLTLAFLLWCSL